MPDERTYGFNKDDAQSLLQSIGNGEAIYAEIKPRTGGSSGSHHMWFTIDSVICDPYGSDTTLIVTPTWYTGGCDKRLPGQDDYGQIEVIDICSILSFYTADFLESGVTGRATYMHPRGDGYCEPAWIVDAICGQPECA